MMKYLLLILVSVAWWMGCSDPGEKIERLPHDTGDLCAHVECVAAGPCFEAGYCDPETGGCVDVPKAEGTVCDDGNLCTYGDVCTAGQCVGENPVSCAALDDCHGDGSCNPEVGCEYPPLENGTVCSDNNACTTNDSCQDGVCGGTPTICAALDDCHEAGVCNSASGQCEYAEKPDDTLCVAQGTGNCEVAMCSSGSCQISAVVCKPLDGCHETGSCDAATGLCANPVKADGVACDDGSVCTRNTVCSAGVCGGGTSIQCELPNGCWEVTGCDPDDGCQLSMRPNGVSCEDGALCTVADTCMEGLCVSGAPRDCTAASVCMNDGYCDETTGNCVNAAKNDGVACDDNDVCTEGTTCTSGVCGQGSVISCTPPGQCAELASCDPLFGCQFADSVDGAACEDGSLCSQNDVCASGVCVAGTSVVCAPSANACVQSRVCAPQTGLCEDVYVAAGTPCDDGDLCTLSETCQSGVCTPAASVSCEAIACEKNVACNPATGVCVGEADPSQDGMECSVDDACVAAASCISGNCTVQSYVTCTAVDSCHDVGTCDPVSGECTQPNMYNGALCTADVCFEDITELSGLGWTAAEGERLILGSMGGAMFDYDGDDYPDIVLAGEGGGVRLYKNLDGELFEERTFVAGLGALASVENITGVVAADYDGDMDLDLFFLRNGANLMYDNQGNGTFVLHPGVGCEGGAAEWSTAAAFGDYDNDGDLDLYVGNYLSLADADFKPGLNHLYENQNGRFTDVTGAFLAGGYGATMDVQWSDCNADGYVDLHVCNDITDFAPEYDPSLLFKNTGAAPLVAQALSVGGEQGPRCLSMAVGDFDGDMVLDLYRGELGDDRLLRGTGAGDYVLQAMTDTDADTDTSMDTATDTDTAVDVDTDSDNCAPDLAGSRAVAVADFNLDGWPDIYVSSGDAVAFANEAIEPYPANELWLNDGGGTFAAVGAQAGLTDTRKGRGVLTGDIDNDGDIDIVQLNFHGQPLVFRNITANGNEWIGVKLESALTNGSGFGAWVEVTGASGTQVREVSTASGPGSSSDPRMIFGLGSDDTATITVTWPSGVVESVGSAAAGTTQIFDEILP